MHVAFALIVRELLMLVVVTALGAGPAALLGPRTGGLVRVALMPVIGLCLGVCIFTSLLWVLPAGATAWLVPGLALGSIVAGLWIARGRRRRALRSRQEKKAALTEERHDAKGSRRWGRLGVVLLPACQIVIISLSVGGPIDYTLHGLSSTGPVFYRVVDALGYVSETDGEEHQTLPQAAHEMATSHPALSSAANLSRVYWERYAHGFQENDATPLEANVNYLVGLGAAETQAPFLVSFIIVGGLGAFATVEYFTRRRRWAAVLAGVLFGGPFFLQLFFDGSQAALCGVAVLGPLVVLGVESIRTPSLTNLVLFSLLMAGLIGLYPLFVPGVVLAGLLVLVALGLRRVVQRRHVRSPASGEEGAITLGIMRATHRKMLSRGGSVRRLVAGFLLVVVLTAGFNPVALDRALRYWLSVLRGGFLGTGLPVYDLSGAVVPGWLLQTRSFYGLGLAGHSEPAVLILVIGLPAVFIVAAVIAPMRFAAAWVILAIAGIFTLLGIYEQVRNTCSYCEDRSLLPIAPLAIILITLAVVGLGISRVKWQRMAGAGLALAILLATGRALYQERTLFARTGYALPASTNALLNDVPTGATVDLEGFNVGGMAPAEQFYTYELASELTTGHVSLPADIADHDALAYVGTFPLTGPQFRPDYEYVLTRAAAVKTNRLLIARVGALALERRRYGLSVTLDAGMSGAPLVHSDRSGRVWVDPSWTQPIQFIVSGGTNVTPAFVELRFRTTSPSVRASSVAPLQQAAGPGRLDVCVEATGAAPVRTADVRLTPATNIELTAMYVSSGSCSGVP